MTPSLFDFHHFDGNGDALAILFRASARFQGLGGL
jgi:hypothetical protein